jgi:hypothetical protein
LEGFSSALIKTVKRPKYLQMSKTQTFNQKRCFFNHSDKCSFIQQNNTRIKTNHYFPKYSRNNRNRLKGIDALKDKFLIERKLLSLITQGNNKKS